MICQHGTAVGDFRRCIFGTKGQQRRRGLRHGRSAASIARTLIVIAAAVCLLIFPASCYGQQVAEVLDLYDWVVLDEALDGAEDGTSEQPGGGREDARLELVDTRRAEQADEEEKEDADVVLTDQLDATEATGSQGPTGTPPPAPTASSATSTPTSSDIAQPTSEPGPGPGPPTSGGGNTTSVPTPAPIIVVTPEPTTPPTFEPTISKMPTPSPTDAPTNLPTNQPTPGPTQEPTFGAVSAITGFYQQDILLTEEKIFTDLQVLIFEDLYQTYTPYYGPGEGLIDPDDPSPAIDTKCELTGQSLLGASPVVADRFGKRYRKNRRNLRHIGPDDIFDLLHGRTLQNGGETDGGGKDETGREEEQRDEDSPATKLSWKLRVIFQITWSSRTIVVDDYANDFPIFINSNLTAVTEDMIASGLRTVKSAQAVFKEAKTPAPTPAPTTKAPTAVPTAAPTIAPSPSPTSRPTAAPTPKPKEGLKPGAIGAVVAGAGAAGLIIGYFLYQSRKQRIEKIRQQQLRSKQHSRGHGSRGGSGGMPPGVVAGGIAGAGHRRNGTSSGSGAWAGQAAMAESAPMNHQNANGTGGAGSEDLRAASPGRPFVYDPNHPDYMEDDYIPTNDSLVSNGSLISMGRDSISSGSAHEMDDRDALGDVFDNYKDQNLEQMRTKVEGTVTNVDGMMSQALTKALMDDDDDSTDENELKWGGSGQSMEIEASVLCDTNDWLKRKDSPSVDERWVLFGQGTVSFRRNFYIYVMLSRLIYLNSHTLFALYLSTPLANHNSRREFMQETLNKMVASVRHGIISPEDASRTIHECAAMLRLELAEKIPETALIITGMRKAVKADEVIDAFKEFGEIEDAAVSPNARGFGLVRFLSPKSVLRALDKFRKEEIVVQDVAVMIRVLKSDDMLMPMRDTPAQPVSAGTPVTARSMGSGAIHVVEAQHGSDLDTIGYQSSLGAGGSRYPVTSRGPGSDTRSDTSGRSSNRSGAGHQRAESSGVASDNGP